MNQKEKLPYFKSKKSREDFALAKFLKRKFFPRIKEKLPRHYFVQPVLSKNLNYILENYKKYPYFLKFDFKLYFPSISHLLLLRKLPLLYRKLAQKPLSRKFNFYLKNELPAILSEASPYQKGLGLGSFLFYILAGIFPLEIDLALKNPFLRYVDDYLVFCKTKNEPAKILAGIIMPNIKKLGLEINEKKLHSGRFSKDKVSFTGFDFSGGYFRITQDKIEEFKQKITKITYLSVKKSQRAIIKLLNNKILGFGHYYKLASSKTAFCDLDAFIRQRLRRWLIRNKDQKDRQANLLLKNEALKAAGLKSLVEICEKHTRKKRYISRKINKNQSKTITVLTNPNLSKIISNTDNIRLKAIFEELQKLAKKITGVEKKITKIERKIDS